MQTNQKKMFVNTGRCTMQNAVFMNPEHRQQHTLIHISITVDGQCNDNLLTLYKTPTTANTEYLRNY